MVDDWNDPIFGHVLCEKNGWFSRDHFFETFLLHYHYMYDDDECNKLKTNRNKVSKTLQVFLSEEDMRFAKWD